MAATDRSAASAAAPLAVRMAHLLGGYGFARLSPEVVAKAKYGAESDFTCIAKVYEEWAGVEMRG